MNNFLENNSNPLWLMTFLSHTALSKDWPIKKMTTYEFGHFTTIFGHFFANYIYISHKTEVLVVILMG